MQDGFDVAVEIAGHQTLEEFVFVDVINNLTIDKVFEFVRFAQIIDGDNLAHTALVERLDKIGADKARCAGNDRVHGFTSIQFIAMPRQARRA